MENTAFDFRTAKKTFSRLALILCAVLILGTLSQIAVIRIPMLIWGGDNWLITSSTGMWISTFAPLYLIAIPAGLLLFRLIPASEPKTCKISAKSFLSFVPMIMFVSYAGNIIGNLLSALLSGGMADNALLDYALDNHPLKVVVMVILAPLLEEYVFRKQLIDRTRCYGEKTAVLLSGFAFGLFHMNLFQFFYAFAGGCLMAYLYVRTGRLRYPVILHSIVNFMGSVLAPAILSLVDLDLLNSMGTGAVPEEMSEAYARMLPGLMIYSLYALALLGLSVTGLVLLIRRRKRFIWKQTECELPRGTAWKTVFGNVGMVLYVVLCLVFIVLSLL